MIETPLHLERLPDVTSAVEAAAEHLVQEIQTAAEHGQKLTVLLAGGSATKLYQAASLKLAALGLASADLSHLTLVVEDDRWPMLNNHQAVAETEFVSNCVAAGASFWRWPVVTREQTTLELNEWLHSTFSAANHRSLLIAGIGPDGHVLGVNVDSNSQRFSSLFEGDALAVSYDSEATTAQFPAFPARITLTISALKQIDSVIVLALGAEKQEVLKNLFSTQQPNHQMPAQALKVIPGRVFTDQPL